MERSRFNRHGADCVVGAVVRAHFIDWQQLDQFESNLSRPINEFTEHSDVADSQIIFTSQPKQRRQNAGNLFIRGQIHSAEMLFRDVSTPLDMTRKNQLRFTSQSSTSWLGISFRNREGRWNTSPYPPVRRMCG